MKLKPFFSYYGSKYRIASKYPRPLHPIIIEPFAGSACYSLHYAHRKVELYDINPRVVGTWQYLIKSSPEEILALPLVIEDVTTLPICQEAKWLIGWWLAVACCEPKIRPMAWSRKENGSNRCGWSVTIRERIAKQVEHIKHWTIKAVSFIHLENRECTWFVDPPYVLKGTEYTYSSVNYEYLGNWCRSRIGRVIVCEQQGATWLPFEYLTQTNSTTGQRKLHSRSTSEVMYTHDSNSNRQ